MDLIGRVEGHRGLEIVWPERVDMDPWVRRDFDYWDSQVDMIPPRQLLKEGILTVTCPWADRYNRWNSLGLARVDKGSQADKKTRSLEQEDYPLAGKGMSPLL